MTSHETYREQLLDLAYGELGKREARALRAHLEECSACREELARITGTRTAMSGLADEPAPERGQAILLAAAREAARERRPKPFLPSWIWGASMGAVGVAAVAVLSLRFADLVQSPTDRHGATEVISRSAPEPSEDKSAPASDHLAAAPAVQPAEPGAEPAPNK